MEKLPKVCRAVGCSTINMNGDTYCDKHKNLSKKPSRVYEHHKIYNTAAWKNLSKNMRIKNPFCEICGEVTDVVDHIIEVKDDDSVGLLEENLQCLCHSCHNSKTARVEGARKAKKLNWFYKIYLAEIKRQDPRKLI